MSWMSDGEEKARTMHDMDAESCWISLTFWLTEVSENQSPRRSLLAQPPTDTFAGVVLLLHETLHRLAEAPARTVLSRTPPNATCLIHAASVSASCNASFVQLRI